MQKDPRQRKPWLLGTSDASTSHGSRTRLLKAQDTASHFSSLATPLTYGNMSGPSAARLVRSKLEALGETMARCEAERLRLINDKEEVVKELRVVEFWAQEDYDACRDLDERKVRL